jgi:flagellar biosynthesis GTPase FlhF
VVTGVGSMSQESEKDHMAVGAEAEADAHLRADGRRQARELPEDPRPAQEEETATQTPAATEAEKRVIELEGKLAECEAARQKAEIDADLRLKQLQHTITLHEASLQLKNAQLEELKENRIRPALQRWIDRSDAEARAAHASEDDCPAGLELLCAKAAHPICVLGAVQWLFEQA